MGRRFATAVVQPVDVDFTLHHVGRLDGPRKQGERCRTRENRQQTADESLSPLGRRLSDNRYYGYRGFPRCESLYHEAVRLALISVLMRSVNACRKPRSPSRLFKYVTYLNGFMSLGMSLSDWAIGMTSRPNVWAMPAS